MRGEHGVPYMGFNGEFAVPGAMTIDGMKSALQRAEKRIKESEKNAEETGGRAHVCGPDGCELV